MCSDLTILFCFLFHVELYDLVLEPIRKLFFCSPVEFKVCNLVHSF